MAQYLEHESQLTFSKINNVRHNILRVLLTILLAIGLSPENVQQNENSALKILVNVIRIFSVVLNFFRV